MISTLDADTLEALLTARDVLRKMLATTRGLATGYVQVAADNIDWIIETSEVLDESPTD